MNLRKKKKRLKKQVEAIRAELDGMLKKPAPVVVKRPKIEKLGSRIILNGEQMRFLDTWDIEEMLTRSICAAIKPYITFHPYERVDYFSQTEEYECRATLRVVVPDGGDGF